MKQLIFGFFCVAFALNTFAGTISSEKTTLMPVTNVVIKLEGYQKDMRYFVIVSTAENNYKFLFRDYSSASAFKNDLLLPNSNTLVRPIAYNIHMVTEVQVTP
jgi:hypothetical protein